MRIIDAHTHIFPSKIATKAAKSIGDFYNVPMYTDAYSERLIEEEGLMRTPNNLISIGKPIEFDEKMLFKKIQELYVEAYNETEKMKWLVHDLVPTYVVDERKE